MVKDEEEEVGMKSEAPPVLEYSSLNLVRRNRHSPRPPAWQPRAIRKVDGREGWREPRNYNSWGLAA